MKNFLHKLKPVEQTGNPVVDESENKEREEYLKMILNFKRPIDDERRIGQNIYSLLEFDLVDELSEKNHLIGHLDKRFVRLHKMYFSKLFRDVKQNPNCSYVTFMENEDIFSGDVPENFSVLLKEIPEINVIDPSVSRSRLYCETVCPRIMNYFGTKTVYNDMLFDEDKKFVLSIDFIKQNQHFYMAEPLNEELAMTMYAPIEDNLKAIDEKIDVLKFKIADDFDGACPTVDNEEIKRRYVQSYLVRGLLMGDMDYRARNFGFIYDELKNEIISAPDFDYELAFSRLAKGYDSTAKNLEYIYANYSDIYKGVVDAIEKFNSTNTATGKPYYEEFIAETVMEKEIAETFCRYIKANSEYLTSKFKEFEKTSSLKQPQ